MCALSGQGERATPELLAAKRHPAFPRALNTWQEPGGVGHSRRAGVSGNWPEPLAPEKPRRVSTGGSGAYKDVRATATATLPGEEAGPARMGSGATGCRGQASPLQVGSPGRSARPLARRICVPTRSLLLEGQGPEASPWSPGPPWRLHVPKRKVL